ncbi:hypothetical protein [Bradyrhizobium valentinum]|uniref:Uncharacterized protein n=1 Tax=Bradyrhizobium valentinum TaxID=1518501 RepID=A0A0R3LDW4_9BRAD|nr:hypothetical protein [Bradyrhizobium valentinum]KRR03142.1 hypothetical protein CP49_04130 [Bradyrhizobium valentinum]KRR14075.1 hypothetical protein CQ10_09715 [Bradyrhizobium valentinum]
MITTPITSIALFAAAFLAISVAQGWAACINPSASEQAISHFRANPQGLVTPNSDTRTIEATTRDLAGTDASLAADLVRVAKGTTPRFQTAIAAGLAQAAVACSTIDQQAGQLIQQAVAGFQDGQFQAAFAAVAGDLSTAATEAATAFATSSVGSVIVVNPNGSRRSTLAPGGGGTVSALVQISAPGLNNPSASSTNAAGPVSPTR